VLIASFVRNRSSGPIKGSGAPPASAERISTIVEGAASMRKFEAEDPFAATGFEDGGLLEAESRRDDSDTRVSTSFDGGLCGARAAAVGTYRRC